MYPRNYFTLNFIIIKIFSVKYGMWILYMYLHIHRYLYMDCSTVSNKSIAFMKA